MSIQTAKDLLIALTSAGFTGDQAARIIAADMISSQLANLNKTITSLAQHYEKTDAS